MKINHIAILSFNFDQCVDHYQEILKIKPSIKIVQSEEIRVAIFQLDNIQLEIFTPIPGNNKFINRKEGLHHMAFENLKTEIEPIHQSIDKDGNPCKFFHPKDMHGVLIESLKTN
jgi:hypothetical protein